MQLVTNTYNNLPDKEFLWIHPSIVVGLGLWLLAAQLYMEHGGIGRIGYAELLAVCKIACCS
jgi:hypothetical protein